MLQHHGSSVVRALQDLFPDVNWQDSNLSKSIFLFLSLYLSLTKNLEVRLLDTWNDPKARRQFFENFAKDNHFDPIVPENWHHQFLKIRIAKVYISLIYYSLYNLYNYTFIIIYIIYMAYLKIFMQDARAVLSYHGNSVSKALKDLFPDIDWSKFNVHFKYVRFSYKIGTNFQCI